MAQKFTDDDTNAVAALANLPLTPDEAKRLTSQFATMLEIFSALQKLSVENIEPTSQVTGLENVMRADVVEENRMFSQEDALRNAPRSHDGFFVVDAVFEEEQ